jgi:hypothetical protein
MSVDAVYINRGYFYEWKLRMSISYAKIKPKSHKFRHTRV